MPKANPKTKNCDLCRKPYRSAKRHTVVKKYFDPKTNTVNNVLIVCGECKTNLHNWQSKYSNSKVHEYNPSRRVTIFGKEFEISGWFGFAERYNGNKKRFKNKDRKNKISVRSFRRYSRKGNGSAAARLRWMHEHELAQRRSRDPEVLKVWTVGEMREFNRMLQEEQKERKAAEAVIMEQLEQEFSEPFRNWLEK